MNGMPELRHDPIQKRWVIISTERSLRPTDFETQVTTSDTSNCPFCAGNESQVPAEIFAFRSPGSKPDDSAWEVRVVSNKFPALRIEGKIGRKGVGLYDVINGIGAHEVIIETPEHTRRMTEYSDEHMAKVIIAYRERIRDLMKDGRFRYVLIFKNEGQRAGASLSHSHTQLIATPVTPKTVALELDSAHEYYRTKERCLFCDILAQEIDTGKRIISENDDFVAFCPFASRFPFEVFLAPKQHSHDFTQLSDSKAHSLGIALRNVLGRLKATLNDPAYNFMIHTSPNTETVPRRTGYWGTLSFDFHWHIEIIPRLTRVAGFEWGTGFYINPTPPEEAASHLRETKVFK
jgi:UDPglucose--hexose-1-phosphate uridylyltransferase